ncbi:hypothetical protein BDZ89DRAFT_1063570 [Hymenopellis radicata]|nr:hypothetical protein BDZ89DRAFT_1063570 [Hymenopellis radicata]
MSRPLPPELVYAIVEYLSDDEKTLRSCALVSRAWSGPSQQALFHYMEFSDYGIMRRCSIRAFKMPIH